LNHNENQSSHVISHVQIIEEKDDDENEEDESPLFDREYRNKSDLSYFELK